MRRILLAAIAGGLFVLGCASSAAVTTTTPEEVIKGGVVVAIGIDGTCVFKPFIKTGDTENDDDGQPQIVGYSPGDVQITRDGKGFIPERVSAAMFIPLKGFKSVHGRLCKCPPYEE